MLRRRLFPFFSAVSLLLCLAVCSLWIQSYFVTYSPRCPRGWAIPRRGTLSLFTVYPLDGRPRFLPLEWRSGPPERFQTLAGQIAEFDSLQRAFPIPGVRRTGFAAGGFVFAMMDGPGQTRRVLIASPLWAPAILLALAPAIWSRSMLRRRRRSKAGRCPRCGYDLRATPDRCPECGAATMAVDAGKT